ncbi:MAG TPA: ABC transporter permease subunit [Terriglobales bacterium]|nr:ABC transporter permease subunit [Terriglobales bacterium]
MRIRTIALNTFGSLVRDKLLIVFAILFTCVILLMMTPLLGMKAMTTASNMQQEQSVILELVSVIIFMVSGCGSLLAAWLAANSVATELKSGTVLAVMARPVKRWEFLAGKFVGVMLLMSLYVVMMFFLGYLLAWLGGQKIQSTPWVLLVYPLVRYAIYSAMAMTLVTVLHPLVSWGIVILVAVGAKITAPSVSVAKPALRWIKEIVYVILPSTGLLSEDRFLTIKDASLRQATWLEHLTTLSYGLDYAFVFLLLAMWSFHYRSLKRD